MHARPILFTGEMVRAILAGRKTQTRRTITPQPSSVEYWAKGKPSDRFNGMAVLRDADGRGWSSCGAFRCKFIADGMCALLGGKLGNSNLEDRTERKSLLWVRETFCKPDKQNPRYAGMVGDYVYRADYEYREPARSVLVDCKWKPSIFMPRAASRITLEIVAVRVERLQDISEKDAKAEGVQARGFKIEISPKDLLEIYINQGLKCALTGLPIDFKAKKWFHGTASIDRIDSKKGYIAGNVQWVHTDINKMKLDFQQDYFIQMCRRVANIGGIWLDENKGKV